MTHPRYEPFSCQTLDGITLRGWLYTVPGPAPAIVMSHGFNCVKEMTLPEVAEQFQDAGYNVLLYDGRSIGESDGWPRNQSSPYQMAEDVSDVICHAETVPSVDKTRIVLWGMSFGAATSACAASVDRRARALVLVCPLLSFVRPDRREGAFGRLISDRRSQLRGNEPLALLPFTAGGDNIVGMGGAGGAGGLEAHALMRAATERGHVNFRNRTTLQTYHKLALFRPRDIMADLLDATPVLMVVPERDNISPPEVQREAFESLRAPKRMHVAWAKGHLNVMTGEGAESVVRAMLDFFKDALDGKIV